MRRGAAVQRLSGRGASKAVHTQVAGRGPTVAGDGLHDVTGCHAPSVEMAEGQFSSRVLTASLQYIGHREPLAERPGGAGRWQRGGSCG